MDRSPNARLEDRLGADEPPYRSRGEAQVGMPTVIYDRGRFRVWRPDFTLPTYGSLIVEYAGMPDRPAYMDGVRHKQKAYRANTMPALFLYPTDLQGKSWPRQVAQRIAYAGRHARDYRQKHAYGSGRRSHR